MLKPFTDYCKDTGQTAGMYEEPTNEDRADRIEELVEQYQRIMGEQPEAPDVCLLACIVADMMHWMDLNSSEDFGRVVELAEFHHAEEQPYVET